MLDALSRLVHNAREEGTMKGVKVSASEELSQVLFVDDNIYSFIIILYLYKKEIGM